MQGRSASELVAQVLAPVSNPKQDPDLSQLNHIRASLATIAANSTGYSLTQPHLERTRLCELADSKLDPSRVWSGRGGGRGDGGHGACGAMGMGTRYNAMRLRLQRTRLRAELDLKLE